MATDLRVCEKAGAKSLYPNWFKICDMLKKEVESLQSFIICATYSQIVSFILIECFYKCLKYMVGCVGFEPTTNRLRVYCSTNWANNPEKILKYHFKIFARQAKRVVFNTRTYPPTKTNLFEIRYLI